MNYLRLSQQYSALKNPNHADQHAGSIAVIGVVMEVLTFGLFLSLGGVVLKRGYLTVRTTSMDEVRTRVLSLVRSSRGDSAAPAEAPRIDGVKPLHKDCPTHIEMSSLGSKPDTRQLSSDSGASAKLPQPQNPRRGPPEADATRQAIDWTEVVDPATGATYYHNTVTNETSWTQPEVRM